MASKPAPNRHIVSGPQPKVRDDDRRGCPPGFSGQPAFVPTPEMREQVRSLAKVVTTKGGTGIKHIAIRLGISESTLTRHFAEDIEAGRAELEIICGTMMVKAATDPVYARQVPKEQMDALRFVLTRQCGWSSKIELSGPGGGAIPVAQFDFTAFIDSKTDEELDALLPALDAIIAAAGDHGPYLDTGGGDVDAGDAIEGEG